MSRQCGTPWGVCGTCEGQGLVQSGEGCSCPACGRGYPAKAFRGPCTHPATVLVEGADQAVAVLCASHAAHPRAALLRKRLLEGLQ